MPHRTLTYIIPTILIVFFSSQLLAAVKIVECEDEQGNKSFQKTCPPGYSVLSEKRLSTGKKEPDRINPKNISADLYMVPDNCEACSKAKDFLNALGINVNQINVADDIESQNKLKEIGGELRVPVTIIEDKILKGFTRSDFENTVKELGLELSSN